jgi:hypothetical protein
MEHPRSKVMRTISQRPAEAVEKGVSSAVLWCSGGGGGGVLHGQTGIRSAPQLKKMKGDDRAHELTETGSR